MTGHDLFRTLAFAYKRRGAETMERAKLLHMLTFDLRWFSPDPAKRLLSRAIAAGLIREEGEMLRLAFDADAVEIPVNFRPREDLTDEEGPLPAAPPGKGDADAMAERERRDGLIDLDVARLILARRRGEDVAERAREMLARPRS